MSIKIMSMIWENGPKDPTEKLVLLAIADHANDDGVAFPSMVGIASKCSITDRGARGIVRRLEAGGWLKTEVGGGRGGRSVYHVLRAETRNDKPGISNPEYQTRNTKAENPERDDTKPGTVVPPNHHITIKEPSISNARGADAECMSILSEAFGEEIAKAFLDHRKAKRAKLTPHAASLVVANLKGHPDPKLVIETSILNGWTGVFPDKVQANPHRRLFDPSKFKG